MKPVRGGPPRRGPGAEPLAFLTLFLLCLLAPAAHAADPDALWKIVHDRCVPDQQAHADPAPCTTVSLAGGEASGWALLKDLRGASQFLLIPTARLGGIESPALLAPDAPNYMADAWDARAAVAHRLGRDLPPEDVALAINSPDARSQDQLHIHIDCVRADVADALRSHRDALGPHWAPFPVPLAGHRYSALLLPGARLDTNPFRLLADAEPAIPLARQTLAVIGTTTADGAPALVLLADHVDLLHGDFAGAEELQDHSCGVLR